jgi:hypothetical protein
MTRHVGELTLARFRQGDLSSRRSLRIRAHLAVCMRCSELNDDLAGVTTLLAEMRPPPMPEHLSARIQAALGAEAARRAGVSAAASSARTETAGAAQPGALAPRPAARSARHERPARGRRQPRPFRLSSPVALRTMAATAAAVVLAGGGYEIASHAGGSGQPSSTVSGPAAAGSSATTPRVAGPMSRAAGTAPQLRYEYDGRQDSIIPVETGTNYASATLGAQVGQELKQNPPSATGQGGTGSLHSNSSRAPATGFAPTVGNIPVTELQGCVSRLAFGRQVLLVDVATYQGRPATVIVTKASAASPEQVWVVGTDCSRTRSDVLTHVTLGATG